MNPQRLSRIAVVVSASLVTVGCSGSPDGLPREPVAGTVTMDDQPLPEAVIQFSPQGDAKDGIVGANAEVKDGAFSIPRESGLVPGKYKVSISHAALKDAPIKAKGRVKKPAEPSSIPSRAKKIGPEEIPARYNTQTELSAEIPPGGKDDLKFDLKSK